jgi:predicted ribonuclease YlaK
MAKASNYSASLPLLLPACQRDGGEMKDCQWHCPIFILIGIETVFLILDTNTFLHYASPDQIDWSEVFPDKRVVLFVCPPVIRELNKHKDTPRTPKLRDRAASALRKLDTWADSPSPIVLKNAVEVRFTIHDPEIDFAAHHLVREIADDHLIAALIELQAKALPSQVLLLTRDIGLKLKARARIGSSVSGVVRG